MVAVRKAVTGCVVFRCDASPSIGAGHIMRCVSLAGAFASSDYEVLFAANEESQAFLPGSIAPSQRVIVSGVPSREPDEIAPRVGAGCNLLVVDHYQRDAAFERACRSFSEHIMAWEDGPHRAHDCDVLLDTGGSHARGDYVSLVPTNSTLLLGPQFAPLRPEFVALRELAISRRDGRPVRRVFISFGATDPAGATIAAIKAIKKSGFDVYIDVAIGPNASDLAALRAVSERRVDLHVGARDVGELMAHADIAIGAGGSMSWERCCLGLPAIVVSIAANQHHIAVSLEEQGAAIYLGPFASDSCEKINDAFVELAGSATRRIAMGQSASVLVDGRGGSRVVDAVREVLR